MKKKKIIIPLIFVCIIFAVFLIVISVKSIYSANVLCDDDTPWVSDDMDIYIKDCEGTLKLEDRTVNIFCGTDYDTIEFIDNDLKSASSTGEAVLFSCECIRNISGDKLSVKVIDSNIDEIKVGDEFEIYKLND